jgi:hypothetical protein
MSAGTPFSVYCIRVKILTSNGSIVIVIYYKFWHRVHSLGILLQKEQVQPVQLLCNCSRMSQLLHLTLMLAFGSVTDNAKLPSAAIFLFRYIFSHSSCP